MNKGFGQARIGQTATGKVHFPGAIHPMNYIRVRRSTR